METEYQGQVRQSLTTNRPLIDRFIRNAKSLAVELDSLENSKDFGSTSTDMGNVSNAIPSIHPLFKINADVPNHNAGFTKSTFAVENQPPTLNSAKSIAMTAIDVVCEKGLLDMINENFEKNTTI